METQKLKISDLRLNKGQIAGLPANPRTWTKADIEKIARSLEETPELLEMRPIIVTPHEGKYIILGGSLRFEGLKHNKAKDAPCEVFEGTPDKMREIVIKDNGSFGAWDYDALGNEWDDNPLTEWGVPAWETEPEETAERNTSKDISDELEFAYKIEITLDDERQQQELYNKLTEEGYVCRILTL